MIVDTVQKATLLHLKENKFCREVCGMTVSDHPISISTDNNFGSVEFDFFAAMQKIIVEGNNNLTMIHTHPDGVNGMSSVDKNMSTGWPLALGIPIRYVILTRDTYIEYELSRVGNKTVMPKIHQYPIFNLDSFCEGHFVTFCNILYGLSTCNYEFDSVKLSKDFSESFL